MINHTKGKYHLVSLGCPKNLVDSESIARLLNLRGLIASETPEDSKYLIVNTCGFLSAAREEAIMVLSDLASTKKSWQKLIAAGCMPELHSKDLIESIPALDGILGTRKWMDILEVLDQIDRQGPAKPYLHLPRKTTHDIALAQWPRFAIQGGSAYIKIADGCRRSCSYCLIPHIKGPLLSRSINAIVEDARILQDQGIKEIILIAQDSTDYGHDLGMRDGLTRLLESLLIAVPHIPWIRLMYAFPGYVTENLLQLIKNEPQILPYLDIPLQHADLSILRSMQRPFNIGAIKQALAHIRAEVEGIALRTTMIVGYPGEDELAFQRLINFVKYVRFDHLGTFNYSFEPGSPAETLGDPISEKTKAKRVDRLMQIQAEISLAINQNFIGQEMEVLIEGIDHENQISIGRTYRDAPEVDGLVIVEGLAPIGDLVSVRINGALTHDLVGKLF